MVFVILVIINFMVITKGAGRIAEVGARFVLDGMPGKQMAIDADLNAGLIAEDEAKTPCRSDPEADFYGSMDGASKFVRGDAIAGILIMVINVVGGLLVGVLQHGMDMGHAAESYTLLTIGDGLVAQIPALVISTAAGVIVTRVSTDQDVGEQMVGQLFSNPRVMLLSAAVLGLLGMVPACQTRYSCCLLPRCWALPGGCVAVKRSLRQSQRRSKCLRTPAVEATGTTFSSKIRWGWKWVPPDPDGGFPAGW